jgi:hypothetical protein
MTSAQHTSDKRWLVTNVVRPRIKRSSDCCTIASDSGSTAEVGSSRIRSAGSARNARAIARRWRCPPDSLTPRSPISVA